MMVQIKKIVEIPILPSNTMLAQYMLCSWVCP